MAKLGGFNPQAHDTESQRDYDNLPDGIYRLEVSSSELKEDKAAGKALLKLTYDVVEPEKYKGRKIFGNINLENPSPQAQEIGQKELASLCRACSIDHEIDDSEELHFVAFTAKVGMGKPSKDGQYPAKNEIKRFYFPDQGDLPTPEITGPVPANDNRRPAANDNKPAAQQQAAASGDKPKRPWGK